MFRIGVEAIETSEKVSLIFKAAQEKKAIDPVLIDLQGRSSVTDYYFLCSGQSSQQLAAIAEAIERVLKKEKIHCLRKEGEMPSEWILLDYGDVVIHVLSEEYRRYYDLETLWKEFLKQKDQR